MVLLVLHLVRERLMSKQFFSRERRARKRTSEFSSVPDGEMFQSRPFVVQTKEGEKSKQQTSNIKTQLSRANRFGHNLSKRSEGGIKAGKMSEKSAVQRQVNREKPEPTKSERLIQLMRKKVKKPEPLTEGELSYANAINDSRIRQTTPDQFDQMLQQWIAEKALDSTDPDPEKIFQAIMQQSQGGVYVGATLSLKQAFMSNIWNCESLADFMCQVWRKCGGQGTAQLDTINDRRISRVGIIPQMTTFSSGNVIDRRTDTKTTVPNRTSFDTHTRASINGVIYDPLMGVSRDAAENIWEYVVESGPPHKIVGTEFKYKTTDDRYGPLKGGIIEKPSLIETLSRKGRKLLTASQGNGAK
jgi:hypothetical protein